MPSSPVTIACCRATYLLANAVMGGLFAGLEAVALPVGPLYLELDARRSLRPKLYLSARRLMGFVCFLADDYYRLDVRWPIIDFVVPLRSLSNRLRQLGPGDQQWQNSWYEREVEASRGRNLCLDPVTPCYW